jgi:hypothetical protein
VFSITVCLAENIGVEGKVCLPNTVAILKCRSLLGILLLDIKFALLIQSRWALHYFDCLAKYHSKCSTTLMYGCCVSIVSSFGLITWLADLLMAVSTSAFIFIFNIYLPFEHFRNTLSLRDKRNILFDCKRNPLCEVIRSALDKGRVESTQIATRISFGSGVCMT